MASIERTAYPRLRINITQRELKEKYTPTMDETHFAHTVARGKKSVTNYLTLLKCFQNLGYFLPIDEIPYIIVKHINRVFGIEKNGIPNTHKNTIYNYYKSIRHYLNIKQYDELAKKLLIDTVTKNSYTMDNPADLINSAIDILVKNNYELPAYSHLDRIVLEIRTKVLNEIFKTTLNLITEETKNLLDNILEVHKNKIFSDFNYLKEPSKKTTFKNMKNLISKLKFSESLGSFENILKFIPYSNYDCANLIQEYPICNYISLKQLN